MAPKEAKPPKRRQGRPQHQATEENRIKVRIMAALGITEDDMALILQLSAPTLRKHYAEPLRIGHLEANTKVAAALYTTAVKGGREGTPAAIFWLRCRAGWREDGYRIPGGTAHQEPQQPKIGKKEERALAAQNPDEETPLGQLMRRRMGMH